jgi:hypothetical protein
MNNFTRLISSFLKKTIENGWTKFPSREKHSPWPQKGHNTIIWFVGFNFLFHN